SSILPCFLLEFEDVFPKNTCQRFFLLSAIKVRSELHPFTQKNLDENVLHICEKTLILGPHWFGAVPKEMVNLEVRNSAVKWSDWIDRLLPRYGDH
ncbi:unnamed protein product, partial [Prunus brigantina]